MTTDKQETFMTITKEMVEKYANATFEVTHPNKLPETIHLNGVEFLNSACIDFIVNQKLEAVYKAGWNKAEQIHYVINRPDIRDVCWDEYKLSEDNLSKREEPSAPQGKYLKAGDKCKHGLKLEACFPCLDENIFKGPYQLSPSSPQPPSQEKCSKCGMSIAGESKVFIDPILGMPHYLGYYKCQCSNSSSQPTPSQEKVACSFHSSRGGYNKDCAMCYQDAKSAALFVNSSPQPTPGKDAPQGKCVQCDGQGFYYHETCSGCNGTGKSSPTNTGEKCSKCGGAGQIMKATPIFPIPYFTACDECGGTGQTINNEVDKNV